MKLMIAGSRSIKNFDLSEYVPPQTDLIISGGANGVDSLAEQYADRYKLSKLILRPRYDLYGRGAPLRRNEQMIEFADEVLVIWDGVSKGTQYSVKYAEKRNKPIRVIIYKGQ